MRELKTNDDAERRATAQFPHALSIELYYSRQCNNSWWNIQLIYSLVSNLGNRFHTMHIDPYHCVSKFRQRIFKPVNFKNMKQIKCSVVKHSFILYHLFTFGNSSLFLQRESEQKLSQVTLSIFFFPRRGISSDRMQKCISVKVSSGKKTPRRANNPSRGSEMWFNIRFPLLLQLIL